jgi:hypothetical protein
MKTKSVFILIVVVAVVVGVGTFYYAGSGSLSSNITKPKKSTQTDIEFEVDQTELIITKSDCTSTRRHAKGCFKVKRGEAGVVFFKFNADSSWKLKKFTICKGTAKGALVCDLSVWERMDFAVANAVVDSAGKIVPGSDLAHTMKDGSIDLTKLNDDKFFLLDVNTIQQDYFYNIQACKGSSCITIDPPIINGGRH